MNGKPGIIDITDFTANANILMLACLEKKELVVDETTGKFSLGKHAVTAPSEQEGLKMSVMLVNSLLNMREKADHRYNQTGQVTRINDFFIEEVKAVGHGYEQFRKLTEKDTEQEVQITQYMVSAIEAILKKEISRKFSEVENAEEDVSETVFGPGPDEVKEAENANSTDGEAEPSEDDHYMNPDDLQNPGKSRWGDADPELVKQRRPIPKPSFSRSSTPSESYYDALPTQPRIATPAPHVQSEDPYSAKALEFADQDHLTSQHQLAFAYLSMRRQAKPMEIGFMKGFRQQLQTGHERLMNPDALNGLDLPGWPDNANGRNTSFQELFGRVNDWITRQESATAQ